MPTLNNDEQKQQEEELKAEKQGLEKLKKMLDSDKKHLEEKITGLNKTIVEQNERLKNKEQLNKELLKLNQDQKTRQAIISDTDKAIKKSKEYIADLTKQLAQAEITRKILVGSLEQPKSADQFIVDKNFMEDIKRTILQLKGNIKKYETTLSNATTKNADAHDKFDRNKSGIEEKTKALESKEKEIKEGQKSFKVAQEELVKLQTKKTIVEKDLEKISQIEAKSTNSLVVQAVVESAEELLPPPPPWTPEEEEEFLQQQQSSASHESKLFELKYENAPASAHTTTGLQEQSDSKEQQEQGMSNPSAFSMPRAGSRDAIISKPVEKITCSTPGQNLTSFWLETKKSEQFCKDNACTVTKKNNEDAFEIKSHAKDILITVQKTTISCDLKKAGTTGEKDAIELMVNAYLKSIEGKNASNHKISGGTPDQKRKIEEWLTEKLKENNLADGASINGKPVLPAAVIETEG